MVLISELKRAFNEFGIINENLTGTLRLGKSQHGKTL